jgi:quercetin dioxygenase-like cupin family protein
MQILSLLNIANKLTIDTDHVISQNEHNTQLLLRLGEGHSYPKEQHALANETIFVMSGSCHLDIAGRVFKLISGDQITVPAGQTHQFLPESACCLNVRFDACLAGNKNTV